MEQTTPKKRAARGISFPCPYCQEPSQKKGLRHYEHVGKVIERHQCIGANGCRRYHMRDVTTHAVIEAPEVVRRPRAQAAPALDLVDRLAGEFGIKMDDLRFKATDRGRPRLLLTCMPDEEIDKLSSTDSNDVRALQRKLLAIKEIIGVYRERAAAYVPATPEGGEAC